MSTETIIIILLGSHFIADFVLQAETWAKNKSSKWGPLLMHTTVYTIAMFIPLIFLVEVENILSNTQKFYFYFSFLIITFLSHTITDYITSREVKKKFDKQKYGSSIPNLEGFTIIGFDQFLHAVQLILTYKFLTLYYI